MEPQTDATNPIAPMIPKLVIGVLIGCVIGLLLGLMLGRSTAPTTSPANVDQSASYDEAYQAGMDAARTKLIERGYLTETPTEFAAMETTYLAGTVTGVSGNRLTLEIEPLDPLGDTYERPVTITSETTLTLLKSKSLEEVEADMEAYTTAMETATDPMDIVYPEPFTTQSIQLADIAVGSPVSIEATAVITETGDITAATVEVMDTTPADLAVPPPLAY